MDGSDRTHPDAAGPAAIDMQQPFLGDIAGRLMSPDADVDRGPVPAILLTICTDGRLPQRRSHRDSGREPATSCARLLATLGRAAPSDLSSVSGLGIEVALEAMAPASRLAIAADLDCWIDWCADEHRRACPADPEDLVRYLRALEAAGRKPATLDRRIASIATVHRLFGIGRDATPTAAPMVRNALRANRRRNGVAQRQATGLRFGGEPDDAQGFTIMAMLAACGGDVQGMRDAALLSLGYDAGLRVGELTAVAVRDLQPQPDGSGLLHLPRSKTDQAGRGGWAWLSPDTMRRIAAWRAQAQIEDGVLFRRVGVDRRRQRDGDSTGRMVSMVTYTIGTADLTRQGVTAIYRRIARMAAAKGLVPLSGEMLEAAIMALSTHSLRVGLTQDLFAAGEDGAGIALALRWSSPSTALRYARQLQVRSGAAARVLSRTRS